MGWDRALSMIFGVAWAAASCGLAHSADLILINKSGEPVQQLFVAPCHHEFWGANQLTHAPLWSGRSFTISNIEPGCYDLMIEVPPWNSCIYSGTILNRTRSLTITWSTLVQASTNDCFRPAHIVSAGKGRYIPNAYQR
jgi:hypothetical protein